MKNIAFMENSGSIRNNLEMCPSGRNEGPMMVVVNEYSKPPLFDGGGQFVDSNKQMGGNGVATEKTPEGLTNNNIIVEGFSGEQGTTWRVVENYIWP